MAQSSDELIKREVYDRVGSIGAVKLRIFPQSSTDDQKLFSAGGLTFGVQGVSYGSCDAAWYVEEDWMDPYDNKTYQKKPVIALEGTDALNRRSSGNAQYQRFHHALGAVKNGITGIYYLRKGSFPIQADLYGMAYFASKVEKGNYLITDDLILVKGLLEAYGTPLFDQLVAAHLDFMYKIFINKFSTKYQGSWQTFAAQRSTILKDDVVIKYAGRMRRNFTDASQRAGHIAVGEMYLTKYYFYDKKVLYLFPKMTHQDLEFLDKSKSVDKEWYLLRNEPNVTIKTLDDVQGLEKDVYSQLVAIRDLPLKGEIWRTYIDCVTTIIAGLNSNKYSLT